jgi:hypothetical protein
MLYLTSWNEHGTTYSRLDTCERDCITTLTEVDSSRTYVETIRMLQRKVTLKGKPCPSRVSAVIVLTVIPS